MAFLTYFSSLLANIRYKFLLQRHPIGGIVHLHQDTDTICLVVSLFVMLAALMITVYLHSFTMGPVLSMLFANMLSGLLKILGNKMEYFACSVMASVHLVVFHGHVPVRVLPELERFLNKELETFIHQPFDVEPRLKTFF